MTTNYKSEINQFIRLNKEDFCEKKMVNGRGFVSINSLLNDANVEFIEKLIKIKRQEDLKEINCTFLKLEDLNYYLDFFSIFKEELIKLQEELLLFFGDDIESNHKVALLISHVSKFRFFLRYITNRNIEKYENKEKLIQNYFFEFININIDLFRSIAFNYGVNLFKKGSIVSPYFNFIETRFSPYFTLADTFIKDFKNEIIEILNNELNVSIEETYPLYFSLNTMKHPLFFIESDDINNFTIHCFGKKIVFYFNFEYIINNEDRVSNLEDLKWNSIYSFFLESDIVMNILERK